MLSVMNNELLTLENWAPKLTKLLILKATRETKKEFTLKEASKTKDRSMKIIAKIVSYKLVSLQRALNLTRINKAVWAAWLILQQALSQLQTLIKKPEPWATSYLKHLMLLFWLKMILWFANLALSDPRTRTIPNRRTLPIFHSTQAKDCKMNV